jgi:hypothetical protein
VRSLAQPARAALGNDDGIAPGQTVCAVDGGHGRLADEYHVFQQSDAELPWAAGALNDDRLVTPQPCMVSAAFSFVFISFALRSMISPRDR